MHKLILIVLAFLLLPRVHAQKKITIEDIYERGIFYPERIRNINWMKDGRFYTAIDENRVIKYEVTSGEAIEIIANGNNLTPKLEIISYSLNSKEDKMLLLTDRQQIYRRSFKAEYYVYDIKTKTLNRLSENGRQSYATFSPDAEKVAFVRDNNLYYVNLNDFSETAVTEDGKFNEIIHGSTDWVYEEELYLTKAFYWSPDSKKLAFYTFDERDVKEYNMQLWSHADPYPHDYRFKYPKAGEDNSKVKISVYHLENQTTVSVDIGNKTDIYIPGVQWTPMPEVLSIQRLNRLQNQLDVLHANATTGESELILSEETNTYISANKDDNLYYLEDGKHFLYSSDRDGFTHIYLYKNNGKLERQITRGNWEVDNFAGFDEATKRIYYTSTEVSPLERHFYSIDLKGKQKVKLSRKAGVNKINVSPDFKYYINSHSNPEQPLEISLFQTEGNKKIKVLVDNQELKEKLNEYELSEKEFFTLKTVDGTSLNGYMLKPSDFDSEKQYPVLMFQYSGPGSQQVLKKWGGSYYFWHQMLAHDGYLIAIVDGRGTGGRGKAFQKITYNRLGELETIDQIEAAKYLSSLNYTDPERIGIWGWSFGGYIASLAMMKGAEYFKAGIAVAPVTNWRYYDTIYTERYLQRPQDNPSGYDDNSPTTHAEKLEGTLLLVHGTGDDNVHVQNTLALQDALIEASKQFYTFYYPNRTHSINSGNARIHLFTMMTKFIKENL